MRLLRLFRRRRSPETEDVFTESAPQEEIAPFVPVEEEGYIPYTPPDAEQAAPTRSRRRLRLPRLRWPGLPRLGVEVNWGALGAALGLILAGVLGTLLQRGDVQGSLQTQWPWALVALGLLWGVLALARRHVTAFLGAAALIGAGLSLLMGTHAIAPARETLFGVVLVAVGLGIVVRGFVLRQRVR